MKNPNNTVSGWLSTAGVITGALGLYLGTALAAGLLTGSAVAGALASNAVLFAAGLIWMKSGRGVETTGLHGGRATEAAGGAFWALVAAALVFSWLVGQTAAVWLYSYAGSDAFDRHASTQAAAPALLMLLLVLVLAPMGEEMLMRGIAYARLRRHLPPLAAALVTSGVFSLMHLNLVQIVATVPLGLVLAAVYEHTGRLTPVILVHVLFNLCSLLVPVGAVSGLASLTFVLLSGVVLALLLVRLYRSLTTAAEGTAGTLEREAVGQ